MNGKYVRPSRDYSWNPAYILRAIHNIILVATAAVGTFTRTTMTEAAPRKRTMLICLGIVKAVYVVKTIMAGQMA
ncbi:hypothetical protein DL769_009422 [Monosporascus sp. CRB-8-3]|nr:hypothetical protein DL769_009422 [Monosporascus sp. CRB-8-3]